MRRSWLRAYAFSLTLLLAVVAGALFGVTFREQAVLLKPWGDLFLNLLFTTVVPLVFFSIAAAVANASGTQRLARIFGAMIGVFVITGIVASVLMGVAVQAVPLGDGVKVDRAALELPGGTINPLQDPGGVAERIVAAVSVSDFMLLFSRQNMLALILFGLLVGYAAMSLRERGRVFAAFLESASAVMMRVIGVVMLYAPIGLGAYFAYLTATLGPELLGAYGKAMALYYPVALAYFFVAFTLYVSWAGGRQAVGRFWRSILPTALTALGTGSSVAAIPANLAAAERAGVPQDIRELVIPVGATIHMDGSCLAAMLKIAVLFGLFQLDFSGAGTLTTAVAIALLSGTVMAGIPGGGFVGEVMIVTLYGFPAAALPIISMIGTLVDPPATMVNAVGDNAASMVVARLLGGRHWTAPAPQ